jgi:hypothetical protein
MTCEKCHARFIADQNQGYPGHCDPPSSLIAYAVLFVIVAAVLGIIGVFVLRTIMFAVAAAFVMGALLSLSNIPEARRVCEQNNGGICPSCGHHNEVKWYS